MLNRRPLTLLLLLLSILLLTLYLLSPLSHTPTTPILPPSISTLGFSTILAVSPSHSPRRPTLLWAANLTGLDIVIPPQKHWTDAEIEHFRAKEGSALTSGSALAWLGHLDVLRYFLESEHETALVIEDDTDFDLVIRERQIPRLAAAVRSLLSNSITLPTHNPDADPNFWAETSTWDILYPGHCDDLPAPSTYLSHPHILYTDPSVPPSHILHPDTQNFLSTLNIPSFSRLLHRAFYPFCTFAYAVNRRPATRILAEFSREHEGGVSAFDVALLQACRDGGWDCWSVVPEIFHHGVGRSEIARADGKERNDNQTDFIEIAERGTWNLGCGARGPGVWVEEHNTVERGEVTRLVTSMVERGECPGDGRERGWKGCEYRECGAQS